MKKNEVKEFSIRAMIDEINQLNKTLSEAYVYEDEMDVPMEDGPMFDEEDDDDCFASQEDRIAQIRELALGGMQEYAQDVDNECYIFYKKVFLETDKLYSNKTKENNIE